MVDDGVRKVVEEEVVRLKGRYSEAFLDIVMEMVNVDPRKRPTFTKISEMIEEFSIE